MKKDSDFEDLLEDILGIVFKAEDVFSHDQPTPEAVAALTHITTSEAAELPREVAVNIQLVLSDLAENGQDGDLNYLFVASKALSHLSFKLGELDWPVSYYDELRALQHRLEAMAQRAGRLGGAKEELELNQRELEDLHLGIITNL